MGGIVTHPRNPGRCPPRPEGIIASVLPADAAEARAALRAGGSSGWVELRADRLDATALRSALQGPRGPVLVTVRDLAEGGAFAGSGEEHRRRLQAALEAGAEAVDVAWGSPPASWALDSAPERTVLSLHPGAVEEPALLDAWTAMAATPAGVIKIVPTAHGPGQVAAVAGLLRRTRSQAPGRLIAFAMGEAGRVSRVMALAWGSRGVFASLEGFGATAPGQLTRRELQEVYRAPSLTRRTRVTLLVGRGVGESPSPAMHNGALRDAGLDGVYVPMELREEAGLAMLLQPASLPALYALAVTIPWKEAAAAACRPGDSLSALARAVNTVHFEGDTPVGFNTDGPGALACIQERMDPAGARVAVLGAGGTARAVAAALVQAGADVTLFSRSGPRGARAASDVGAVWRPWEQRDARGCDLLVQATPLGRAGELPIPEDRLPKRLVLDVVYGPSPTPLVQAARRRGLAVVDGFELLVRQAVLQFRILTGQDADPRRMAARGRAWLTERERPA